MLFKGNPPKRVLVINIFGIGDVLFTTPLISNLKANYPDLTIGYVCNSRTATLLERNPKIDKVFTYDRDEFNEAFRRSKILGIKKWIGFLRDIKKEGFDTSIDVSLSDLTNWVTWMAGIKRRIGFKYKGRGFFLNQKFPLKGYEDKHVVEYYLSLLENIGIPTDTKDLELSIDQADMDWADRFIAEKIDQSNEKPLIGLVPGGGASWGKDSIYKRWEPEKYAKLADKLIEKFSAAFILMGDKSELELCEKVSTAMAHKPATACGETTISQFAALARKCSLMIVNDGGPLHIAVAAGVRTASIFGPVNEQVYGPYPLGNHIVIKKNLACQPCYRRFRKASCEHISCLNQLTVDEVFEQVQGAL